MEPNSSTIRLNASLKYFISCWVMPIIRTKWIRLFFHAMGISLCSTQMKERSAYWLRAWGTASALVKAVQDNDSRSKTSWTKASVT